MFRQEFRIASGTINGNVLVGRAVWHEDVNDPGDCCVVGVRLLLEGDVLEFSYFMEGDAAGDAIFLRREEGI